MVMIGSLFAGHIESPGKTVEIDGGAFKEYYGSAKNFQRRLRTSRKKDFIACQGSLQDALTRNGTRFASSISYAGGRKLRI